MRVLELALAGVLALGASTAAHAAPLAGKPGRGATRPAAGIVNVWGGCGWG
jgi:hypothetical protein